MQLSQLEALLGVMEHGSFLAAAQALNRRRGTLKAQVEALETELGQELVLRSTLGTTATRAGEVFAVRARALLQDAASLRGFLDQGAPVQRLRVAIPPGLPPNLLAFTTEILDARLPGTRLEFVVCSPEEALSDPDVDLIGQFRDVLPLGDHRTFVMQRFPVRLLASPRYLDARGRPSSVEDLAEHDLLAWTGHRPERVGVWRCLDGATFPVTPAVASNDTHLIRCLAAAGQGIALVADAPQVVGTLGSIELEPVLDGIVGEEAHGRILIPDRAAELPAVRAIVQLAREFALEQHELRPVSVV